MRDDKYLNNRLDVLWQRFFADIKRNNIVRIKFGRKARRRLGSIRKYHSNNNSNFETLIYINGHFRNHQIPGFVIDATICHELAHYAHGFSSPLPQLSRFPHRGGMIDKEMIKRKINPLVATESEWLKNNWLEYLESKAPQKQRKNRRPSPQTTESSLSTTALTALSASRTRFL